MSGTAPRRKGVELAEEMVVLVEVMVAEAEVGRPTSTPSKVLLLEQEATLCSKTGLLGSPLRPRLGNQKQNSSTANLGIGATLAIAGAQLMALTNIPVPPGPAPTLD